jgi:hypothetical protein
MKKEKDNLDLILSGEYNPEDYKNSKRYDDVRKEMEEEEKRKLEDDDDYLEELNYQRGFMYKKGGMIPFQNSNLYINGFNLDINGNSVVKVSFPNSRAFSIQTNGVLKETHNLYTKNIDKLSLKQLNIIEHEVADYISKYGSKEQKNKLRIYNDSDDYAKGGSTYAEGGEIESWKYNWGTWEAKISKHPRRKEYKWIVYDINGNDTYDFYKDIDVKLETPLEAENNMFRNIEDRIGYTPKRQISSTSYQGGGEIKEGDFVKKKGSNIELKVVEVGNDWRSGKDYIKIYNDVTDNTTTLVDWSDYELTSTYQGGGEIGNSGLLTEEFVTKIEAAEISIWNAYDDPLTIAFGVGTVNWQFYTEIRSWGIKEVGVYVVSVKLTIYEDDKETKIIEIDSNADTEWEIETDTAHIDFSNNVYPQLIDVDMKTKIISINFN